MSETFTVATPEELEQDRLMREKQTYTGTQASTTGLATGGGLGSAAQAAMPNEWNPERGMYGGSYDSSGANQRQLADTGARLSGNVNSATRNNQDLMNQAIDATYAGESNANSALNASYQSLQTSGAKAQSEIGRASDRMYRGASAATGAGTDYAAQGRSAGTQGAPLVGALESFAEQQQSTSAAQLQLAQARDANMANAMALASSGRGGGANAAAQMQGMANATAANSQASQSAAILRAQEEQAWRGQQMAALQSAGQLENQYLNTGAQYGQLGLGYSQLAAQQNAQALQGLTQGQQAALQWNQLAQQNQLAQNQNTQAYLGYLNQNAQQAGQWGMQGSLAANQLEQSFAGMQQQQLANETQNNISGYIEQMKAGAQVGQTNANNRTDVNKANTGAVFSMGGSLLSGLGGLI